MSAYARLSRIKPIRLNEHGAGLRCQGREDDRQRDFAQKFEHRMRSRECKLWVRYYVRD